MSNATTAEIAIVVGATGAFGQAIVAKLIAKGLSVIAVARTASALQTLKAQFPNIVICATDISADTAIHDIRCLLNNTVRIIVHGPGVTVAGGILNAPTAALTDAVNIKVNGMLRLVRAADAFLKPHSRLVAIGGHYGLEPTAYAAAAGIANAALINVMRQLSLAYGERTITAHVIAPGPADTERLRKVAADKAQAHNGTIDDVYQQLRQESSLGQLTTPQQVAWAVALLLDEEATVMTGSTLMLDAGRRRGLP